MELRLKKSGLTLVDGGISTEITDGERDALTARQDEVLVIWEDAFTNSQM
jgi:hypothetical protein